MQRYTDSQNQYIAEQEYEDYSIGDPVKIENDQTTIGYVSEIEDTASGFQAYVVVEA